MTFNRSLKKRLLRLEIWLSLAWARFLIRWVPFRYWRGLLGVIEGEQSDDERPQLSPEQRKQASDIGRIVNRVADHLRLFEAVCLPRAMTSRWVLARRGLPSRIIIGSRRGDMEEGLLFHAWLMVGDVVVTGESERADFMAFDKGKMPQRSADNVV